MGQIKKQIETKQNWDPFITCLLFYIKHIPQAVDLQIKLKDASKRRVIDHIDVCEMVSVNTINPLNTNLTDWH